MRRNLGIAIAIGLALALMSGMRRSPMRSLWSWRRSRYLGAGRIVVRIASWRSLARRVPPMALRWW